MTNTRILLAVSSILVGCSGEAPRQPVGPLPGAVVSTPLATSSVADAPSTPPLPKKLEFEVVLEQSKLHDGGDAMYFQHLEVDDGILLVASMPPKAFMIRGSKVEALPGFFEGLRSPAPDWGPNDYMVGGLEGTMKDLRFDIYAPSTVYSDVVEGTPHHWKTRSGTKKGATAKQGAWVTVGTITEPITTPKGARLYEKANRGETASGGFSFRFDGPAKSDVLPKPTPGKNGCKAALLGHPFLTYLKDGTLVGFGTLCTSGEDPLAIGKLDGVAPPFQSIGSRFAPGHIAAEHFRGDTATVYPLPGAEKVADFATFETLLRPSGELVMVTQIAGPKRNQAYVAQFDGKQWVDLTPANPPEQLQGYISPDNVLYLFHQSGGFRQKQGGWEPIALDRSEECGTEWVSDTSALPGGDLLVSGAPHCLWHIGQGSVHGELVELPNDLFTGKVVVHQGEAYMFADGMHGATLLHVKP